MDSDITIGKNFNDAVYFMPKVMPLANMVRLPPSMPSRICFVFGSRGVVWNKFFIMETFIAGGMEANGLSLEQTWNGIGPDLVWSNRD
jgi:hypothetical protein